VGIPVSTPPSSNEGRPANYCWPLSQTLPICRVVELLNFGLGGFEPEFGDGVRTGDGIGGDEPVHFRTFQQEDLTKIL
jgi:hypothetical protein